MISETGKKTKKKTVYNYRKMRGRTSHADHQNAKNMHNEVYSPLLFPPALITSPVLFKLILHHPPPHPTATKKIKKLS